MTAYEEFLVNQEIKKFQQELEIYKKASRLMARNIFSDMDCERKYEECEKLIIYQLPCDKCIDCIVNDYLQKAREEQE